MKTELVRVLLAKERELEYQESVRSSGTASRLIAELTRDEADESFFVLSLDVRNRVVNVYLAAKGCGDTVQLKPAAVFRAAIMSNAAGVIVGHNHPSGDPSPSAEDRALTKRLRECAELLGIRFLDHVITGADGRFYSFSDAGNLRE